MTTLDSVEEEDRSYRFYCLEQSVKFGISAGEVDAKMVETVAELFYNFISKKS